MRATRRASLPHICIPSFSIPTATLRDLTFSSRCCLSIFVGRLTRPASIRILATFPGSVHDRVLRVLSRGAAISATASFCDLDAERSHPLTRRYSKRLIPFPAICRPLVPFNSSRFPLFAPAAYAAGATA
jgi:hypothetical protein